MSKHGGHVEMKKTLGLTGVSVNAMALIAPGAFLWLTFQVQAAQIDTAGKSTAGDMFAGLVFALILAFLTAISYTKLAELYPNAGTGSAYYFAEHAFLNKVLLLALFDGDFPDVIDGENHRSFSRILAA